MKANKCGGIEKDRSSKGSWRVQRGIMSLIWGTRNYFCSGLPKKCVVLSYILAKVMDSVISVIYPNKEQSLAAGKGCAYSQQTLIFARTRF